MSEMQVRDVMTHLVVTLRPSDQLRDAAHRLVVNRISGAPVVVDGKLAGVVSEADLVRAFTPYARSNGTSTRSAPLMLLLRGTMPHVAQNLTVADVMTRDVATIRPGASVRQAAALIDRRGVRRLPVVDDEGYVVGIIARSDVVRAMALGEESLLERSPA